MIAMRSKLLLIGIIALLSGASLAADLKMRSEPAFVSYSSSEGTYPVAVTLNNTGPHARGVLRVTSGDFQMDYPVELPTGSAKRLVVYPQLSYGDEVTLELSTNQGDVKGKFRQLLAADSGGRGVLMIGDHQGDLGFLRGEGGNGDVNRMSDCYVKPELAPDRSIAYGGLAAVVLGPGAERLKEGAVRALRQFAMSGGTICFLGGASSPVLEDLRWRGLLPVRAVGPKTVQSSALLSNLPPRVALEEGFSILETVPVDGAATRKEGGNILVARKEYGLGQGVFFAFNPVEQPFTRWPGRRALFEKFLRPYDSERARGFLSRFGRSSYDPYGMYAAPSSGAYTYSTSTGGYISVTSSSAYGYGGDPDQPSDPFSTTLPPAEKVFWILLGYFMVIVPINFLLLKKLKRGELAWFTAPLISVGFAGAFFASAKDLYSAKLSTATQGLVIATPDSQESLFVGASQLFFPQGGEYDLKIEGLQSIGNSKSADEYYGYYGGRTRSQSEGLNPVDVGQVLVNRMSVSNLAFRELAFRQTLSTGKWLETNLRRSGNGTTLRVKNLSPHALKGATAVVAGGNFPLPEMAPGASVEIALPAKVQPEKRQQREQYSYGGPTARYEDLAHLTQDSKEIVIRAPLKDLRVGPQIGRLVEARQNVVLAFFTGIRFEEIRL